MPPVSPLPDSPTIIDTSHAYFPEIACIDFSFLPNPAYAGVEYLMSPIYGNIKFTHILLADGSNLRDSNTTFPYLKDRLLKKVCDNAFNTQDKSTIALLTDCFTFTAPFDNSKASKPLCTIRSLERAMHFVTKTNCNTTDIILYIHINWSSIFINMNPTPINVHNFAHFGQTSFPKTHYHPSSPSNQQFVALFNQQTTSNIVQQQSKMLTNLNQPKTSPQTLHRYIPMKFDTIANDRYTFSSHTHYRFHTPDQLTLLHDANITPPHQMSYVIDSAYPASSFPKHYGTYFVLTNFGTSSEKNFY
eukprot:jgi/Psemu1/30471/gm1.30471_g